MAGISIIIKEKRKSPYMIFLLAASFYLYEYILQVSPSVMADAIMQTFGVGAVGLGTISAFYFYAYAPMQLPAGVLFDRYGPRRLMTLAILICVTGTFFFSSTDSIFMAACGRFLIGVGSAFSFVGVLVLVSHWFPANKFALMVGITQLMSSIGALLAEVPLAHLSDAIGWRDSMFCLACLGLVLGGLVWFFVRDTPEGTQKAKKSVSFTKEWRKLLIVARNPQTWWVGLYASCVWTPVVVFAALWGVPYIENLFSVNKIVASSLCMWIWIGIGFGSPLLGWLSDKLNSRRLPLLLAAITGTISATYVIFPQTNNMLVMGVMLFFMGIAAAGQPLSFALVKENNQANYVGTASGLNNFLVLFIGAIFQPVVGIILRFNWNHEYVNNLPMYSHHAYQLALVILPVCYLLAMLIIVCCINETASSTCSDVPNARRQLKVRHT